MVGSRRVARDLGALRLRSRLRHQSLRGRRRSRSRSAPDLRAARRARAAPGPVSHRSRRRQQGQRLDLRDGRLDAARGRSAGGVAHLPAPAPFSRALRDRRRTGRTRRLRGLGPARLRKDGDDRSEPARAWPLDRVRDRDRDGVRHLRSLRLRDRRDRSRHGRHARRHQRRRSGGERDHAAGFRACRRAGAGHGRDRRQQGRHHQARPARGQRASGRDRRSSHHRGRATRAFAVAAARTRLGRHGKLALVFGNRALGLVRPSRQRPGRRSSNGERRRRDNRLVGRPRPPTAD